MNGSRILCIGDAHKRSTETEEQKDRFRAVGSHVHAEKPDVVVSIGDLEDMPSLAAHAGSRAVGGAGSNRSHINKRLDKDLQSLDEALALMNMTTDIANRRHISSRRRDRIWELRRVFICGNHEMRVEKVPEYQPEMQGLIGIKLVQEIVEARGWEFVPYLDRISIEGILFSHYFTSGPMGRAVGINQALNQLSESCVWGHTHRFGYDTRKSAAGRSLHALCLPTFKPTNRLQPHEESGVVWLNEARKGDFQIARVSTRKLLNQYNKKSSERAVPCHYQNQSAITSLL